MTTICRDACQLSDKAGCYETHHRCGTCKVWWKKELLTPTKNGFLNFCPCCSAKLRTRPRKRSVPLNSNRTKLVNYSSELNNMDHLNPFFHSHGKRVVVFCNFKGKCEEKIITEKWKYCVWNKPMSICLFLDKCNQQNVMTTNTALRTYGVK